MKMRCIDENLYVVNGDFDIARMEPGWRVVEFNNHAKGRAQLDTRESKQSYLIAADALLALESGSLDFGDWH